jgi:hypothetical protein
MLRLHFALCWLFYIKIIYYRIFISSFQSTDSGLTLGLFSDMEVIGFPTPLNELFLFPIVTSTC